ncbi:HAD hydrolase-like protein [uncultured Cellulomonas sp.]|uniref:HAD hydrolase-like protein n=1 Tax=uncultured Cellulomonas sp. TaxID=189682 RepID=UPI0028E93547|nr:HAD hydrolase-like protein [uncultured Cellulomonas sp.]
MTSPLVLLDLDGTLTDSAPGITAAIATTYRTLGLPVPSPAELRSFVGPPITQSFPAHGVPLDRVTEAVRAYRAVFVDGMIRDNRVYDGIPEALVELRAAGLRLVVATSKPEVYAHPICDAFGLTGLVDGIFGAPLDESTSTKADVIAAALAANPGASPLVMVGDREHDVHGATENGIRTIGVTWGYAAPGELLAAGAAELVDTPSELTTAVLRRLVVATA